MNIKDIIERNGRMSHTKSAYVIGVLVSSWAVIYMTLHKTLTADMMLFYLGATVVGSLGSKAAEIYGLRKEPKVDDTYSLGSRESTGSEKSTW